MSSYGELNAAVVDDSRFIREYVSAALTHIGLKSVDSFESGGAALNAIEKNIKHYHLVVCDLNMPGVDGVSIMRWLSESHYQGGVVLISGENRKLLKTVATVARANKLNVLGTLAKPIREDLDYFG